MALGDQQDIIARLRAVLPSSWFVQGQNPVTEAVLASMGWMGAQLTSLLAYVKQQARISSVSDVFLDIAARDYTGARVTRRLQESDESFRQRLQASLLPNGATRAALVARLTSLTGTAPWVFEPTQPQDTGAYGYGGLGYNSAGGYGSLALPFQAFVGVQRPTAQGVPNLAGYSGNTSIPPYAPGGYNAGLLAYCDIAQAFDGVTDAEIYQTIASVQPCGAIAWTQIKA